MVSTVLGAKLPYDSVAIITLVKEDGERKILQSKDFADPQKRSAFIAETANAVRAKGIPVL